HTRFSRDWSSDVCSSDLEEGYDLEQLKALLERVNTNGRSMGMALTSCTVPHVGKPTFELAEDEMEIGIGIHGEPGRQRMKLKPRSEERRVGEEGRSGGRR